MAPGFKLMCLDWVSLGLTVMAAGLQCAGFFSPAWWTHEGSVGASYMGITGLRMCHVLCVDKTVLDIEGGKEWVLLVRVFEVFGDFFVLLALLFAVLVVTLRRKSIHRGLVYIHGAAALFILAGVFTFLGCYSSLERDLEGQGALQYPFALCLVAGIVCIGTSAVTGFALKKHLVELDWDEPDDDAGGYV